MIQRFLLVMASLAILATPLVAESGKQGSAQTLVRIDISHRIYGVKGVLTSKGSMNCFLAPGRRAALLLFWIGDARVGLGGTASGAPIAVSGAGSCWSYAAAKKAMASRPGSMMNMPDAPQFLIEADGLVEVEPNGTVLLTMYQDSQIFKEFDQAGMPVTTSRKKEREISLTPGSSKSLVLHPEISQSSIRGFPGAVIVDLEALVLTRP